MSKSVFFAPLDVSRSTNELLVQSFQTHKHPTEPFEERWRSSSSEGVVAKKTEGRVPCLDPVAPAFSSRLRLLLLRQRRARVLAKQVALDLNEDETLFIRNCVDEESRFSVQVGCGAKLPSQENFEDHYNARHMASCSVCSRVYPTSRLLSIHISEAHDSSFQAKVARGYSMLLQMNPLFVNKDSTLVTCSFLFHFILRS
ncbi:hypothetical protein MLD38_022617 [Melastoma candidum]|uniref:Uncharacterized protein n=1 Tax=Melastoma candidum TaxID=119954 RepID=A0ACB9QLP7_9MYRT|nr:hypothetical protein MLD38_022617 [Melastoma candidum]